MPISVLKEKAEKIKSQLDGLDIRIREDQTEVGGGSLPGVMLPSVVIEIHHQSYPAHVIERKLRGGVPTVIGRITKDTYLIDVRTIQEGEIASLVKAIIGVLQ